MLWDKKRRPPTGKETLEIELCFRAHSLVAEMGEESRIDSATAVTRGQRFQVGNLPDGTGEDRSHVDILAAWMEEGWFQIHILCSGTPDGRPRTDSVAVRAGERRCQFGTFAAGMGD